jgi:multimeric flavodoxin WrbA
MRVLLLVGSPRKGNSASETLGAYLLDGLADRGASVERRYVYPAVKAANKLETLVAATVRADLVILAAPLYLDSLPAPVIQLLEILAQRLEEQDRPEGQQFMAIVNCGFPEAHHNDVALAIYRRFAGEAGFVWAGGMAVGGGEPLKGRRLAESGGMGRNVRAALDLAAEALAEGLPVPEEAQLLISEPLMPAWLYRTMGQVGWWFQARKYGNQWKLRARFWGA